MKSRMREIRKYGSVRGVRQTSHINKIRKRGGVEMSTRQWF